MPHKVLILFAHPLFENSKAHRAMYEALPKSNRVYFHDLYEAYPDFHIDITAEQELLKNYDIIIWQHPIYWYNCPPLLKQWIDLVLVYDWAYGPNGNALKGKTLMQVVSTGGRKEYYSHEGKNHYTIPDLLQPFSQTAEVCGMDYLPPLVFHGTHEMEYEQYKAVGAFYHKAIQFLLDNDIDARQVKDFLYFNDWINQQQHVG